MKWGPSIPWLAAGICALVALGANAQEAKKDWDFLLAGMRKERSALKSGICRLQGHTTTKSENPDNDVDGQVTIFAAIDDGKSRFDRTEPGWEPDPTKARLDPDHPGQVISSNRRAIVTYKYCNNGKRVAHWMVGQPIFGVHAETKKPPPISLGWLDLRALGLYHEIAIGRGYNLDQLLNEYSEAKTIREVDKSDPNIWVAVLGFVDQFDMDTEFRFSVDVAHGFTPLAYTLREGKRGQQSTWPTRQQSKTVWTQVNNVWVPTHYEYTLNLGYNRHYWFDLKWDSVNEPIKADLFEYKSFDAPDSVAVVDNSLGQPITLHQPPPQVMNSGITWTWIIVGVGSVLAIVGTGVWLISRRLRA